MQTQAGSFLAEDTRELARFDLVIDEVFSKPALITKNPIDNRSPVTDHIQEQQLDLVVKVQITESPFKHQAEADWQFAVTPENNRGYRAWRWLEQRRYEQTFSYLSARFGLIEQVAIANIEWDVTSNEHTVFTVTLTHIDFAYSSQVLLPPERKKKPSQVPIIDEGAKDTKTLDPAFADDSHLMDGIQKSIGNAKIRGKAALNAFAGG